MEKQISIQGKEYKLKSSLFSIISYRNTFGSELFSDITTIEKINKLIEVEEGFHASYKLTEIMSSTEERKK